MDQKKNQRKHQQRMTVINDIHRNNPDGETPPEPVKPKQKSPFYFYIILLVIPVMFFVLLEASLQLFGYGKDIPQWYSVSDKKYILNPDIARRYFFSMKEVPTSNHDAFDKVKSVNTFRVFVLGESSGAGYPYLPIGAFSGYLQRRLEFLYPDINVEVINLSMTAINTYTLRDLMPGVLGQRPDLIVIYTGHNEYYGALGVNSMGVIGKSPALVNMYIKLNRFKTVELIRNIIQSLSKKLPNEKASGSEGTLMSRMAEGGQIPFGSDQYTAGLKQFESNMKAILEMARESHVPVIMGTLTSNLKDQVPLSLLQNERDRSAGNVYSQAQSEYSKGNAAAALELFKKARDLDAIRFRAPGEINRIIKNLGKEYNFPVADVDSAFNSNSPGGITGNDLMTDHLHPNLKGYQLMGKIFYETMKKSAVLPKTVPEKYDDTVLDQLTVVNYGFSRLDSVIAAFRITALKNDWPFVRQENKRPLESIIKLNNYEDTLAFMACFEGVPWEKVHRKASERYLRNKDIKEFRQIVDILIQKYTAIPEYRTYLIDNLLIFKQYDAAYAYLQKFYKKDPDAYTAKWLGLISLNNQKFEDAVNFLNESLKMNPNDAQVLYNLSGAYVNKKDYENAYKAVDQCLRTDPSFPGAVQLKNQLAAALNQMH
ncbi:MAG: GDSL-type esterase/lipase family protein [Syntrophothermus sp.]